MKYTELPKIYKKIYMNLRLKPFDIMFYSDFFNCDFSFIFQFVQKKK